MAKFYDAAMAKAETACLGQWRQELLADISGTVIEIGAGTGVNLDYYTHKVTDLTLTEPDRHMRNRLERKLSATSMRHTVVEAAAEALPFADAYFDVAVVTLVLCSVDCPRQSLGELYRILKPGGKLVLIEHVGAPDFKNIYKWQKRIEPFWKNCAGNCHLTRDTLTTLKAGGFNCDNVQHDAMRGAVALVAPVIRGIAEKP